MRKLHETERAPPKCRTFALDFLFRLAQTIISYFAELKRMIFEITRSLTYE